MDGSSGLPIGSAKGINSQDGADPPNQSALSLNFQEETNGFAHTHEATTQYGDTGVGRGGEQEGCRYQVFRHVTQAGRSSQQPCHAAPPHTRQWLPPCGKKCKPTLLLWSKEGQQMLFPEEDRTEHRGRHLSTPRFSDGLHTNQ